MMLVDLGFKTEDSVVKYEEAALVTLIKERLSLSDEVILSFLTQFSLSSRGKWETLPAGFKLADVYPWRYSRPLSMMRRPIVQYES
jgi:hypothetical protein